MSDSPSPDAPKPVAQAEPKPTRRRRLWRWFKKWTRRALLLVLVLLTVFSVWYPIHRALAYRASDRTVAEVRAELDATDPGWRLDDIEAKYTSSLPPPEKNSFRWIAQVPELIDALPRDPAEREQLIALLEEFGSDAGSGWANRLPPPEVRKYLRAATAPCPPDHPAVVALAAAEAGGAPFVSAWDMRSPGWEPVNSASRAGYRLGVCGHHAAVTGDHAAAVQYARAALGCGRAVGAMPRSDAEFARSFCAIGAHGVVRRTLAWGVPKVELEPLQREVLAEAERDPVPTALRGDRAALDRDERPPNARDEAGVFFLRRDGHKELTLNDRLLMYAVRPYKERSRAHALRTVTKLIAACERPAHQRRDAFRDIQRAARDDLIRSWNPYHRWWGEEWNAHAWGGPRQDGTTRALLRTVAVALACERFRQERGRWPAALADLVPAYLAAVPADPFDAKPLRYLLRPEGALVYSIGTNEFDDGGLWYLASDNRPLDICFLLWNPELRGLPAEEPVPLVPNDPNPGEP